MLREVENLGISSLQLVKLMIYHQCFDRTTISIIPKNENTRKIRIIGFGNQISFTPVFLDTSKGGE